MGVEEGVAGESEDVQVMMCLAFVPLGSGTQVIVMTKGPDARSPGRGPLVRVAGQFVEPARRMGSRRKQETWGRDT